jgi:hypothetical protein
MTARWLLFEERYGIHLRAAEREQALEEARIAAKYQRSVAELKRRQQE